MLPYADIRPSRTGVIQQSLLDQLFYILLFPKVSLWTDSLRAQLFFSKILTLFGSTYGDKISKKHRLSSESVVSIFINI